MKDFIWNGIAYTKKQVTKPMNVGIKHLCIARTTNRTHPERVGDLRSIGFGANGLKRWRFDWEETGSERQHNRGFGEVSLHNYEWFELHPRAQEIARPMRVTEPSQQTVIVAIKQDKAMISIFRCAAKSLMADGTGSDMLLEIIDSMEKDLKKQA